MIISAQKLVINIYDARSEKHKINCLSLFIYFLPYNMRASA